MLNSNLVINNFRKNFNKKSHILFFYEYICILFAKYIKGITIYNNCNFLTLYIDCLYLNPFITLLKKHF